MIWTKQTWGKPFVLNAVHTHRAHTTHVSCSGLIWLGKNCHIANINLESVNNHLIKINIDELNFKYYVMSIRYGTIWIVETIDHIIWLLLIVSFEVIFDLQAAYWNIIETSQKIYCTYINSSWRLVNSACNIFLKTLKKIIFEKVDFFWYIWFVFISFFFLKILNFFQSDRAA